MILPAGRKVRIGNYEVLKYSRSLGKKELKKLREGVTDKLPASVMENLQRGVLPYIKISTISGSWSVEFVVGTMMYEAINEIPVAKDGEGNLTYYGNGYANLYHIINCMFCDTTIVGDVEYQKTKIKNMGEYLERAAKEKLAQEAEKTPEQQAEESDKAAQEVLDREEHAAKIIEMGEYLRKEADDNNRTDKDN